MSLPTLKTNVPITLNGTNDTNQPVEINIPEGTILQPYQIKSKGVRENDDEYFCYLIIDGKKYNNVRIKVSLVGEGQPFSISRRKLPAAFYGGEPSALAADAADLHPTAPDDPVKLDGGRRRKSKSRRRNSKRRHRARKSTKRRR